MPYRPAVGCLAAVAGLSQELRGRALRIVCLALVVDERGLGTGTATAVTAAVGTMQGSALPAALCPAVVLRRGGGMGMGARPWAVSRAWRVPPAQQGGMVGSEVLASWAMRSGRAAPDRRSDEPARGGRIQITRAHWPETNQTGIKPEGARAISSRRASQAADGRRL